jgi:hypothetical protein
MTSRLRNITLSLLATAAIGTLARYSAAADTIVQVPVDGVIDGRTVSTLEMGAIVSWTPGQGVDGDGNGDGYVTDAVEAVLNTQGKTVGGQIGKALPDDGVFPADNRHPEIVLHYSNTAPSTSPQTHQIYIAQGPQNFSLPVPQATYSKLFLILTASEGAADLTITLNYMGAAPVSANFHLPDYGVGGAAANDPVYFNLIEGMRKWTQTNQEGDGPSHTITGIEIAPSATDMLTSVDIMKTNGSHVVFWGATGIATSAVNLGTGGAGGTGGAAGAGGGAGMGGVSAGGAQMTGGSGGSAGLAAGGTSAVAGTGGTVTGGTGGTVTAGGAAGNTGTIANAGATTAAGGMMAQAGAQAGGQAGSSAGGTVATSAPAANESSGCALSRAPVPSSAPRIALAVALATFLFKRRRRG